MADEAKPTTVPSAAAAPTSTPPGVKPAPSQAPVGGKPVDPPRVRKRNLSTTTVPGGRYIVKGVAVDANGNPHPDKFDEIKDGEVVPDEEFVS